MPSAESLAIRQSLAQLEQGSAEALGRAYRQEAEAGHRFRPAGAVSKEAIFQGIAPRTGRHQPPRGASLLEASVEHHVDVSAAEGSWWKRVKG